MKKINYKKIINLTLWIFAISGLITSWSFASKKQSKSEVKNLTITIVNSSDNEFIDEIDVKAFFDDRNDAILNNELNNIDITSLEKALNTHPAIENSEISYDLNGDFKISVKQRRPLVRIINSNGESYYIDSTSRIMPLSYKSTSRVIIANGFINEPFARRYNYTIEDINKNGGLKELSVLDDIYELTQHLYADSLLSKMIHQIYVTKDREFILSPIIGHHTIELGKINDLQVKLNKLNLFYTQGLNKTDSWNKYEIINLKYKNLVVCTKK